MEATIPNDDFELFQQGAMAGKKGDILKATMRVLSEKGFHQATIDEIADEAGVGKGTIYSYFESKAALVEELIEVIGGFQLEQTIRFIETTEDANNVSAKDEMLMLIEHELRFIQNHTALAQYLVARDTLGLSPQFQKRISKGQNEYHTIIAAIVKRGRDQGVFSDKIDPSVAASMIMGLRLQMLRDWINDGMRLPLETIKEQIVIFMLHGLTPV